MAGCASDNILIGRDRASVDEIREFRMSPSNSNDVSRVWEVMYQNVAKANNIIKLVPDMNLDGSFKNQALGTALFFRGFSMLWMVPYYGDDTNGGIPIITDKTPTAEIDSPRPSHVLQNYDQIIEDFPRGRRDPALLFATSGRSDRSSAQGAAWAYAARAALYASMYDAKYYDVVIEMCDKVMNMTGADKRSLYVIRRTSQVVRQPLAQGAEPLFEYIFSGGQQIPRRPLSRRIVRQCRLGPLQYVGLLYAESGALQSLRGGRYAPRCDDPLAGPAHSVHGTGYSFRRLFADGSVYSITSRTTAHALRGMVLQFMSPWETGSYSEVSNLRDKPLEFAQLLPDALCRRDADEGRGADLDQGRRRRRGQELLNDIRERAGLPRNSQATKAQLRTSAAVNSLSNSSPAVSWT